MLATSSYDVGARNTSAPVNFFRERRSDPGLDRITSASRRESRASGGRQPPDGVPHIRGLTPPARPRHATPTTKPLLPFVRGDGLDRGPARPAGEASGSASEFGLAGRKRLHVAR